MKIIRKGTPSDLNRILDLLADARVYMAETGNPDQWRDTWPPREIIEDDIKVGKNYVVDDDELGVVGTFFISDEKDPTYTKIYNGSWVDDEKPYVVIHRITTDRNTRGVGRFIMDWAYEICGNVRIDTHENNSPMRGLLKACGFEYCGIIYLETGEERLAFQKIATENF